MEDNRSRNGLQRQSTIDNIKMQYTQYSFCHLEIVKIFCCVANFSDRKDLLSLRATWLTSY